MEKRKKLEAQIPVNLLHDHVESSIYVEALECEDDKLGYALCLPLSAISYVRPSD